MDSHKEQLMSMDFRCACSSRLTKMTAVEHRRSGLFSPEMVIYECALCGKRATVFHKPETLLVRTTEQPA